MAFPSSIISPKGYGGRVTALLGEPLRDGPLGAKRGDLPRQPATLPGQRGFPLGLARQARLGQALRIGGGHGEGVAWIGCVMARDDERRQVTELELRDRLEARRARHLAEGPRDRIRMAVLEHPPTSEAQDRLSPC